MHGEEGKFVINSTSGIVTTAGALDRETKDSYTVFVATLLCNKRVKCIEVLASNVRQVRSICLCLFFFLFSGTSPFSNCNWTGIARRPA